MLNTTHYTAAEAKIIHKEIEEEYYKIARKLEPTREWPQLIEHIKREETSHRAGQFSREFQITKSQAIRLFAVKRLLEYAIAYQGIQPPKAEEFLNVVTSCFAAYAVYSKNKSYFEVYNSPANKATTEYKLARWDYALLA